MKVEGMAPRDFRPGRRVRSDASRSWWASLTATGLVIRHGGALRAIALDSVGTVDIEWAGLFARRLRIDVASGELTFEGLRPRTARHFRSAVLVAAEEARDALRVRAQHDAFKAFLKHVEEWEGDVRHARDDELVTRGWLSPEFAAKWDGRRPAERPSGLLGDGSLRSSLAGLPAAQLRRLALWSGGVRSILGEWNEAHVRTELLARRPFFDAIERSPLTDEQARAVVCFPDRLQVVASAGAGKTSTIVAKAAYAVDRALVRPERILLLAFNQDAAAELRGRIDQRFAAVGLDPTGIESTTFHAFGLKVLGHATGRKPTVAPWAAADPLGQLARIVEELRSADARFRSDWDLYRFVWSRELPQFGKESEEPDDWNPASRTAGFRTLNGESVRSRGERMIADWLFFNGVEYEYERPYEIDVADADHGRYRPDFYYPQVDGYHEHWAFDESGRAPAEFVGYEESAAWKRAIHREHGTTLIQTTMAGLWDGTAFVHLASELESRGVTLAPDPDRPIPGQRPIENERLVKTMLAFLSHVKSNRLSADALRARLSATGSGPLRHRHEVFLRLFAAVRVEWERKLQDDDLVDFEDMLSLAADAIEGGTWESPFDLVLVDELQDASASRARLVRALAARPRTRLCAVGDDWQSINRFAGADMSVMTRFSDVFGPSTVVRLERTFRSPQALCDIAAGFVQKNPAQLAKRVVSAAPSAAVPVKVVATGADSEYRDVIKQLLDEFAAEAGENVLHRPSVLVLGRYNRDRDFMPVEGRRRWPQLHITFTTAHKSKGLEADYVVIPGMTRRSFPSAVQDDPVLRLAMPAAEVFPDAEERRLFYVALTRAKRQAVLLTVTGQESPFVSELARDFGVAVTDRRGMPAAPPVRCPACGKGVLVQRTSRFGPFMGCSRFPRCSHTKNLPVPAVAQAQPFAHNALNSRQL